MSNTPIVIEEHQHSMRVSASWLQQATQVASSQGDALVFARLPETLKSFFERYPPTPFKQYATKPTLTTAEDANPFLPNKHPVTQKYHQPKYSLRRQSELWKLAYQFGISDCLPQLQGDKKFYQEKYDANEFMKGQLRPKGKKHDKSRQQRREEIALAVEQADEKIIAVKGNKYKRLLERRSQKSTNWI